MRFALIDGAGSIPSPLLRAWCQPKRLFCLERSAGLPPTRRHGAAGACPVGLCLVEQHLWQSPGRELRDIGLVVGRRRIARLMRDNGLQARQKRRFKRTTDSHHAWPVAPNLLDQDFTATGPDGPGCRHHLRVDPRRLVVPRGCHRPVRSSGRRLGNRRPVASGPGSVCSAQILTMRRPAAGLVHHSDRGSRGGIQAVVATRCLSADRRNWSSASAGVFQSSVFRGRELRVASTAAISSAP